MAKLVLVNRENRLKLVRAKLQTLIVFILSLFLIPVLVLLTLPIYTFRYFIFKIAPIIRPDLGKMLCTRSAIFAADDIYHHPMCTIVVKLITEGTLEIATSREIILKNWINAKNPDGSLKFAELQQCVIKWCGFPFWKNEETFRLAEHVKLLEQCPATSFVTEAQLTQHINELGLQSFDKTKSPWELIIVPNFLRDGFDEHEGFPTSALLFRFHHCLSDGFGVRKLILTTCTGNFDSLEKKQIVKKNNSWIRILLEGIYASVLGPYDFIKYNIEKCDPVRANSWHLPEDESPKKWTVSHSNERISVELVKEIKNSFGVSFNAVVMAAIAGSIRNFMLRQPTRKLPAFIHAGVPFPVKDHPGKLRNSWGSTVIKLPVGEPSAKRRLLYVHGQIEKMKKAPLNLISFTAMVLGGGVFSCLTKKVIHIRNVSAVVSCMPGPSFHGYFLNKKVTNVEFSIGLGPGNIGFLITSLSYNGTISLFSTVDNRLIPGVEGVKALSNNVKEEILKFKEQIQEQV